jgi:hypothetical protein
LVAKIVKAESPRWFSGTIAVCFGVTPSLIRKPSRGIATH